MACTGEIHVKIEYPEMDTDGGDLTFIRGAVFQGYWAGSKGWTDIGSVKFPVDEFCWSPPDDGTFAVRYCILRNGIICSSTGRVHCVSRSEPSAPETYNVSLEASKEPPKPIVSMDCPNCEVELALAD